MGWLPYQIKHNNSFENISNFKQLRTTIMEMGFKMKLRK
jgi:hypothetical protein